MNFRVLQPTILIDINRIPELAFIQGTDSAGISIGAMTRQAQVEHDPLIAERTPLLHEILPNIAHPQIRNRGTIGGSLVHADPASELPVYALARDARMRLQNASGERWVDAADFFLGMFTTALNPDEMLVEIEVAPPPDGFGWSFQEMARRKGDYALMGVAAWIVLDAQGVCQDARLVYLNAGDGPIRSRQAEQALKDQVLGAEIIDEVARIAAEQEIDPFGSVHATVDFQRHLARVLTRRTLQTALSRTKNGRRT
jgi:carbon-monoxide dehydrogenase medium subunit